ncbi:MAG: sulfotransferase [Ginsengibacter sp.]
MSKLFPFPLYTFLRIARKNGGFSPKGLLHMGPWLLKTILAEPFRWIELATKNKTIEKHTIQKPPVFLLGYYRSGTTFLQQMFMQDRRLGYMSLYQTIFPELMLTFEKIFTPLLEFSTRLFNAKNSFHRIPLTWHSSGEEDVGLTGMVSPYAFHWGYLFPEKNNDYFEKHVLFKNISDEEIQNWKNTYHYFLKKLSIANKSKQLILKNPPNTARIKMLLSLFPDAKFIYIHRNPFEVYASNKQLWKMIHNKFMLGRSRSVDFKNIILDSYSKMINRYFEDKLLIPPGQLIELRYETFIENPVSCLRNIYSQLDLLDFSYCEPAMVAYASKQKNYSKLKHYLPQKEQEIVSEKWKKFTEYNNYQHYEKET